VRTRSVSRSLANSLRALGTLTLLSTALACTNTVIDSSAQLRDPARTWDEQMARAKRFHRQGLYPSAEHQYGLALETSRSFGSGDPRIVETLTRRVELRLSRGHYRGAEDDYQAILAAERVNSRDRGEALANALNNLAVFYIDLDRIAEAEELLTEAVEIRTAIYGGGHPFVAVLLQNLGDAERRAENYATAEALLVRALSSYQAAGKVFDREASIAQNTLARVYRATDRDQESEQNHLDAIRLSIAVGGERNTDVGVFMRDLAALYTKQRRFSEAENLYRGSIEILRERLGDSSHQLSKSYRAYSAMLRAAGRGQEAARYRERADATGY
jgi:tetratricopeptide (TPR) repeat protein